MRHNHLRHGLELAARDAQEAAQRDRSLGHLRDAASPVWQCGRLGCDALVKHGRSFCDLHVPKEDGDA